MRRWKELGFELYSLCAIDLCSAETRPPSVVYTWPDLDMVAVSAEAHQHRLWQILRRQDLHFWWLLEQL
uniref:Uncharacterized protein n=1 Tax=Oryza glumipatula TaxID=40148 RepID=A0A0E0BMW3_9ORYZ